MADPIAKIPPAWPKSTAPHRRALWVLMAAAFSIAIATAWPHSAEGSEPAERTELVVLVHGLGRTELSMIPLRLMLEDAGYEVLNWGYSSFCCRLETIGQELASELEAIESPRPARIHFIGHSFGNIIIRWMLANAPPTEPGRVVMLAPPNQGSTTADRWAPYFGWLLAPLDDLVTDPTGAAASLPPITEREVGIVAGEYDGKVSIEETRLKGAEDHTVVPATHTFIMNDGETREQILRFLEVGAFEDVAE
ncbi:hypothetical protein FRC96_11545 [Lujinxingia vulgaris]|uniref:DUF676 domain-containing protein n=1 Tax=Lujinxingia vulgaris TaxID=2600176 RepID=A0A5C6X861_9DELT|nr:hypothetical protein [Lujinxingia vulgaris]TXD35302.1 hypothetical protein FRC96_11545 [Lujinxingia vulgaris]